MHASSVRLWNNEIPLAILVKILIDVIKIWSHFTVHIVPEGNLNQLIEMIILDWISNWPPITDTVELIEDWSTGTDEAVLDSSFQTPVPYLLKS